MKNRLVGITLLGICIVAGLITGLFSRSIEAALTLTMNDKTNAGTSGAVMPIPTSAINQVPTPTPSPLPIGVNILAQDTFQRPNQTFWGTASDGRTWEGDANKANVFSIAGGAGQVGNAQGAYNALLGPSSTNAEVVASASMNRFDSGNVNMGEYYAGPAAITGTRHSLMVPNWPYSSDSMAQPLNLALYPSSLMQVLRI
jgi:hypothetical protein